MEHIDQYQSGNWCVFCQYCILSIWNIYNTANLEWKWNMFLQPMFCVTSEKKCLDINLIWLFTPFYTFYLEKEKCDKKVFKFKKKPCQSHWQKNVVIFFIKKMSRFFLSKKSIRHFHSKPFISVYRFHCILKGADSVAVEFCLHCTNYTFHIVYDWCI